MLPDPKGGGVLLSSRQGRQAGFSWLFGSCRALQHSLPMLTCTPPRYPLTCPRTACNVMLSAAVLFAAGGAYYVYITFLGYSALPFLERTEVGGPVRVGTRDL